MKLNMRKKDAQNGDYMAEKGILQEIAEKTEERIQVQKRELSPDRMKKEALEKAEADIEVGKETFAFTKALKKPGVSFICEVKKASPSKGVIAEQFPYVQIAREYEAAGADAVSVLTEPFYFLGKDTYLQEIRKEVGIPLLRKDFTVEEYMIYQAKVLGADAVLLICSILSPMQLSEYLGIADSLGLSALVEAHTEAEIEMALSAKAGIIGVNNRNLGNFTVDIQNFGRLREKVPENVLFVSESGMKTREDIEVLEKNGTNAVLIGETLMRSPDKRKMLQTLRGME